MNALNALNLSEAGLQGFAMSAPRTHPAPPIVVEATLVPVAVAQQTMMVTVPAGVLPGGQFQAQTPSGMMMVTCPPTSNAGDQCVT